MANPVPERGETQWPRIVPLGNTKTGQIQNRTVPTRVRDANEAAVLPQVRSSRQAIQRLITWQIEDSVADRLF